MDPERSFGERLRQRRTRLGMSRPVLAGLVGRSAEWVKAVESGRLAVPRLPMLLRLAEVLGVRDLAELTGETSSTIDRFARGQHPSVPAIRQVVQRYSVVRADRPAVPVAVLRDRCAGAWRTWHTAADRRDAVGAVLPALLTDCQHTAAVVVGHERRAAHAVLADAYHLAQHVIVNAAEPELLWLVVDRAMAAAQVADTPLALAGAAWTVGMMLRVAGRAEEALALVGEAADVLEPTLPDGTDEARAMWGALQLHGAVTAGRAGRDGDAWALWDMADRAARVLPAGYVHPWTMFGTGNVAIHSVSLTVDLWKSREALRRAERIDPDLLPSRERRGRLFVEMSRGHHAAGDRIAATRLLLRACDEGIDAVVWSPAARVIVDDLVARPPTAVRADVAALAAKVAAVPG
jgi:transcriptional regulator with XRE-family HTH domain